MHSMATNLHILFIWLVCFLLVLDASASVGPVSSGEVGICRSRVEIYGYRCEDHTVTTEDGYILGMQRIPTGRFGPRSGANKITVILQHGLLMDGVTWLLNSPAESLGYILADNGYDVWIPNSRGTVESLGHTTLSSSDPVLFFFLTLHVALAFLLTTWSLKSCSDIQAYWNWSWDELSAYDLPATFRYIYNQTGQQKIHFAAHSLGTLIAIGSICDGNILNMIRSAVLLSPIAYLDQIASPFARASADLFLAEAYYWLGLHEFDPTSKVVHDLQNAVCNTPGVNCYDLMAAFTGPNCCLNASTEQIYQQHEPQATATKNMIHLSQMIRTGTITKYDYGNPADNKKYYGQITPPAYNISGIPSDLPIFIGYGGKDLLSDVKDVDHLLDSLKFHDVNKLTVHFIAKYAHADLSMGINAKQMIYDSMMAFFDLY